MSYDSDGLTSRAAAGTNTVSTLLQLVGGWSKPSGRGLWMFRSITIAFSTAVSYRSTIPWHRAIERLFNSYTAKGVVGLTFAFASGIMFVAGAQAFAIGSCLGFVGGTLINYRNTLADARFAVQKHPRLMQHHLHANFPLLGWNEEDLVKKRADGLLNHVFEGSGTWQNQSQLLAAHQTALPTLTDLELKREAAIVDEEYPS